VSERLQGAARAGALVGAIGAVALTLYAGRGSPQRLVMILMAGWVLAPFFGYALISRFAARWSTGARFALDLAILVIAMAALVVYGRDALQPPPRRAGPYVLLPGLSWVVLLVIAAGGWLSGRRPPVDANSVH